MEVTGIIILEVKFTCQYVLIIILLSASFWLVIITLHNSNYILGLTGVFFIYVNGELHS